MMIVARKSGRLGNRLFTFAHLLANAKEYNYTVLDPVFDEYADYFVGTSQQYLTGYPVGSLPGVRWPRKILNYLLYSVCNPIRSDRIAWLHSCFHEALDLHHPATYPWKDTKYLDFVHHKVVITNGWVFWDHENVLKHVGFLREFFSLTPQHTAIINDFQAKCRKSSPIVIGIHIRRGDYQIAAGGVFFHDISAYAELMQKMVSLFEVPPCFLVCSDEKLQEKDFPGLSVVVGPGDAVLDMYSLAACDYIAGVPSTFSGWASFYGQTPLYYIYDMSKALQEISLQEFIPMNSFDHLDPTLRYQGREAK